MGLVTLEPVDFTETFDSGGACGLSPSSPFVFANATADPEAVQLWIDNPSPGSGPKAAIVDGSIAERHKSPAQNTSCYLAMTDETLYFLGSIEYLGFSWNSMDEYNSIAAFEPSGQPIFVTWFGLDVHGQQLWSNFSAIPYSDQYVNLHFPPGEGLAGMYFRSFTNWAFEIDNISIRYRNSPGVAPAAVRPVPAAPTVADVPSPGALTLFALGLTALAARRAPAVSVLRERPCPR